MSIATVCPSHLTTWSSDPPSVAANREGEKIAQAMKFAQETGFDPSLLDDPDAPAPPGGAAEDSEDEDSD